MCFIFFFNFYLNTYTHTHKEDLTIMVYFVSLHIGVNGLFFICHLIPLYHSKGAPGKALMVYRIERPLVQLF